MGLTQMAADTCGDVGLIPGCEIKTVTRVCDWLQAAGRLLGP